MSQVIRKPIIARPRWIETRQPENAADEQSLAPIDAMTMTLWLAFAGAMILGLAVRIVDLNAVGLNTDEVVYAGQAAGILGDPALKPFFPVFRAHPLLFQFILAMVYSVVGVSDIVGRLVSVVFGTMTICVVFALGRILYSSRVGVLAALLIAINPYHVIITRQILLDGPMTFFATLSLLCAACYARTRLSRWLYATGVCIGLTFLAKETGIVLIGSLYLFFALCPIIKISARQLLTSLLIIVVFIAIFPLATTLAGAGNTGQSYLVWQLLRRPNHPWHFYATTVAPAIGVLLVVIALAGMIFLRQARTWREILLISWMIVPTAFFQFWQVKGFQYLLPIVSALCVLSASVIFRINFTTDSIRFGSLNISVVLIRRISIFVVVLSLAIPCWIAVRAVPTLSALAGQGGSPGGREAGRWFKNNTSPDVQILTVGPAIANPIQFYGQRKTHMLSISQNPMLRNPAYDPIDNPDLSLRNGDIHYIVWDAYSAFRSKFFSDKLMEYVERYNGKAVHTEAMHGEPILVIYKVRP